MPRTVRRDGVGVLEVEGFRPVRDTGDFIDSACVTGTSLTAPLPIAPRLFICAVILLIGAVKEQLIGDDRTAQLGAVVVLGFDVVAFELVTPEHEP